MTVLLGLIFVTSFAGLMLVLNVAGRARIGRNLREIPAFLRLRRAVGLAVEAGTRLHVSLGWGGLLGTQNASALIGLTVLERIARAASVSDCPPVATSGEGALGILSQDTLRSTARAIGIDHQFDPYSGQVTGVTPLSYAAGVVPILRDENVSASLLAGHFGSEIALVVEGGERTGAITIGGSDTLTGQAVLFAAAHEPLIGEELFASGAYLGAGTMHVASLRVQDVMRWVLVLVIVVGAVAKMAGVL